MHSVPDSSRASLSVENASTQRLELLLTQRLRVPIWEFPKTGEPNIVP